MIRLFCAALALAGTLSLCGPALADDGCPQHFLGGRAPVLTTPQPGAVELRSEAFVTLWSPATRDPIYSAEYLTPACLTKADHEVRLDAFHADDRLPKGERAELSDYAGGPYDRGHLAPAHDMPSPTAMHESFVLSNMIPQAPANNRGVWAQTETFTRRLVILAREGYVVTGPVFTPVPGKAAPAPLAGRVHVPAQLFKAVFVPPSQFNPTGQVGAYLVDNTADAKPKVVSLDVVKALAGLDPFPSLSAVDHARADLPTVAGK